MKRSFFLILLLSLNVLLLYCQKESQKFIINTFNADSVRNDRKDKDEYLRTNTKSPIPEVDRKDFQGLKYFDPTSEYVVQAEMMKFQSIDTTRIPRKKKNDTLRMLRYGYFRFKLHDSTFVLTVFAELPAQTPLKFFIPFVDKTCGIESYDAGRYIDMDEIPGAKNYILDFNQAYNPYCAYNSRYSCPIVPKENYLNTSIRAGEKIYHQE